MPEHSTDIHLPLSRPDAMIPGDASPVLVVGPSADRIVSMHGADWIAARDPDALPDETVFAAVLLADVLAGVEDPSALLRRVSALVRPGGVVGLSVPNARSWMVIKGLLEGTFKPSPFGALRPGDRHLFTRATLCDLVEAADLRVVDVSGTLTAEMPPKDIEAGLLAFDLRTAGLVEEGGILAHHIAARRPERDDPGISLLDPSAPADRLDGEIEVVACSPETAGLVPALAEAAARSRGRTLALGCSGADQARELAADLDEWTDIVVREGALVCRREALFGMGRIEGTYDALDGVIHDLVLRASLGGRSVRHLAPLRDLEGADREAFLDRHGWVRRVDQKDPIPAVTGAGPINPAGATLTVALIARDEEETLPRCLESVKAIADEIVVVDTGSRDRTAEIARSFGARVIHFAWCDDFSAARNVSLDAVKTEWVLILDADEVLLPEAVEKIRGALTSETIAACMLPLENEGAAEVESGVLLLRLWRARPSIRFCYRIHEQVAGAVLRFARRNGLHFESLEGATIRHTGYDPEVVESRGKIERNRRHFEAQLERYPTDLYSWYKYADFLRENGSPAVATVAIARAHEILRATPPDEITRLPYSGEVVALHVLELLNVGRKREAWAASEILNRLDLSSAHAWYARGLSALQTDHPEAALEAFRRCRSYEGKTGAIPTDPVIAGEAAAVGEARALVTLGREEDARVLLVEAIEHHPRSVKLLLGIFNAGGDADKVLADLWRRHGSDEFARDVRLMGAEAFIVLDRLDRAVTWLAETGDLSDPEVASALGELHLHAGRPAEAQDAWAACPDDASCRAGAALAAALRGQAEDLAPLGREDAEHLRTYLVNLRRSGRQDLFEAAARACVQSRLMGSAGDA
jgi:glycosyltransferase involved in cell wall biosynthesis